MQYDRTPEEAAAIGRKIYAGMQAELEANHWGRLVVIDINSGDYEVGDYAGESSDLALTKQLLKRRPDANPWAEVIGKENALAVRLSWRQTMWVLAEEKKRRHD